jgi:hypothetical protein
MKKIIITLLLASSVCVNSAIAKVFRYVDPTANGGFMVSKMSWPPDYYIYCYADEDVCDICPTMATAEEAPIFDPTDRTAMATLFNQADIEIFTNGDFTGSINATFWVLGEHSPRVYNVSWLQNNEGIIEMVFDRVS